MHLCGNVRLSQGWGTDGDLGESRIFQRGWVMAAAAGGLSVELQARPCAAGFQNKIGPPLDRVRVGAAGFARLCVAEGRKAG